MTKVAEAYTFDYTQRGRVPLQLASPTSSSIPSDLLLSLLLTKALSAISVHTTKAWLLDAGTSPLALNSGFLLIGAVGALVFGVSGSAAAATPSSGKPKRAKIDTAEVLKYAALNLAQWTCWWMAVDRLSVFKVFLLSQYAAIWCPTRLNTASATRNALFLLASLFSLSFYSDYSPLTITPIATGYGALLVHIFLSSRQSLLLQETMGDSSRIARLGLILSAAASLPFGIYGYLTQHSALTAESASSLLPLLLFASSVLLILGPFVDRTVGKNVIKARLISSGWLCAVICAWFVGLVAFGQRWTWRDFGLIIFARTILGMVTSASPALFGHIASSYSTPGSKADQPRDLNFLETASTFVRRTRAVIKAILQNDESRRIYYFLCLNFSYMGVQMAWGIWTNSLGLISDSIHMFFDNAALALGLFASVMSTWPSDQVFTYGYSRVETLSGFANGLFLILISIFIVFEAIQRLMDPPEMNTNQLLTVSALGLAVNLVGLVATGGHHHHGHSHGHDHGVRAIFMNAEIAEAPRSMTIQDTITGMTTMVKIEDDSRLWSLTAAPAGHGHGHSHNMSGVFLHVMADTLGSVGVIISTLLINRYGWTGFDPLASIFIAVLIFASVVPLVQDSGMLLCLDLGPNREEEVRKALSELSTIEGLSSCAAPRFWPMDPDTLVGSIHIQLTPSPSSHDPSRPHAPNHYHNVDRVVARVDAALRKSIPGLGTLDIQVEGADGLASCHCLT